MCITKKNEYSQGGSERTEGVGAMGTSSWSYLCNSKSRSWITSCAVNPLWKK
jgi:hypothetical protein